MISAGDSAHQSPIGRPKSLALLAQPVVRHGEYSGVR